MSKQRLWSQHRRVYVLALLATTAVCVLSLTAAPAAATAKGAQIGTTAAKPTPAPDRVKSTDAQLQRRVRRLLLEDPRTRSFAAAATVQNGGVILEGKTYSSQTRLLAGTLVSGLPGVRSVDNRIALAPNADLQVAQKLHAALSQDPIVDDAAIAVTVVNHKIYLSGIVASEEQRSRANELALSIPGIISVSNGIEVPPGAKIHLPRTPVAARSYLGYRPASH